MYTISAAMQRLNSSATFRHHHSESELAASPPPNQQVQILHDRELEHTPFDVLFSFEFLADAVEPLFELRWVFIVLFVTGSVLRVGGVAQLPSSCVRNPAYWEENCLQPILGTLTRSPGGKRI